MITSLIVSESYGASGVHLVDSFTQKKNTNHRIILCTIIKCLLQSSKKEQLIDLIWHFQGLISIQKGTGCLNKVVFGMSNFFLSSLHRKNKKKIDKALNSVIFWPSLLLSLRRLSLVNGLCNYFRLQSKNDADISKLNRPFFFKEKLTPKLF